MNPVRLLHLRKTIARHIQLAYILILRDISIRIRRRFPSTDSLITAGLITKEEQEMMENCRLPAHACHYWIPIQWIVVRIREMRAKNKVDSLMSDYESMELFGEISRMRSNLGDLLSYDWVPMPIAFQQIIISTVYIYILLSVFSVCVVDEKNFTNWLNLLWSFTITLCQLIFFLGYLKSIQVITNPFGYDDDDFEVDYLIDHYRMTLQELLGGTDLKLPKAERPSSRELPYTVASMFLLQNKSMGMAGSLAYEQSGNGKD